nr:MAG TPA: dissimilatory sulfite reductase D [Caudoviricetes sp.]
MRKNTGVSYYILEYLKEADYGLTLHDFYRHFPDTKEQTIRSALSKLKDSGNIFAEKGRYYFQDVFDNESITESLNIESSKFRKKNIYRKFLQLIVENIEVSTDHSIKIQYIQEGRKLLKEMR